MVTTRSQTRNLLVSGQPFETPRGTSGATLDTIAARLRTAPLPRLPPASARAAAVLAALFEDERGRVCVVLTRRSNKLKTHSGEVCLPGGKRDEEDADDVACALREAHEELGLPPSVVQVLTTMPALLSKHKLSVTPVVARVPPGVTYTPNQEEVAEVFHMPLDAFLEDHARHSHRDVEWDGFAYRLHYFKHDEFVVWGLTAAILIEVAQVAFGRAPAFEVHTPGHPPYTLIGFDGQRLTYRA